MRGAHVKSQMRRMLRECFFKTHYLPIRQRGSRWQSGVSSLSAPPSSPFTCGGKKETGKNRNRRAYVEVLTPVSDAGTARCAPQGSGFGDILRQTWTLQAPRDDCGKDATSHHPHATRLRWTTIRGCFSNKCAE